MDTDKINSSGGFAKTVSLPKQEVTEEERRFVSSMNDREKELMNLYESLRKDAAETAG